MGEEDENPHGRENVESEGEKSKEKCRKKVSGGFLSKYIREGGER